MLRSSTMNKNPASPAVNIKPNSSGNPCETVHDRPCKLIFLDLPQLGRPPGHPHLFCSRAVGGGEGAPRGCPPRPASSRWRLEVRAPFLPARVPTFPAPDRHNHRPRWGFLRSAPHTCPLDSPSGAPSSGEEAAGSSGCTADTRAPPSRLPAPSAPPPADGAPGLTLPGKRKRRD